MSHSGNCPICGNYLEKDLTCKSCNVQVITDDVKDISPELQEQIKKMKNVSLDDVHELAYKENHLSKSVQKKTKVRKCSNKKYVKRKKSKNGKRKKK